MTLPLEEELEQFQRYASLWFRTVLYELVADVKFLVTNKKPFEFVMLYR